MFIPPSSTYGQSIVVDASVWISSLLATDRNHVAASRWINNHVAGNGVVVAPILLAVETGSAISRVTHDLSWARTAVAQLYVLPSIRLANLDQQLIADAAEIAIAYAIRGADAIYVALAAQLDIPLVTLDHEQLTRPASIITTISP